MNRRQTASELKRARFCDEWMRNGGNATAASRVLWPHLSPARHRVTGSKMLKQCRDMGLLAQRVQSAAMGLKELVQRTSDVARANILDCADVRPDGSFAFNVAKARDAGMGPLIKRLRHDAESGAPIIELYEADAARTQLGKWLGAEKAPEPPPAQVNVSVVLAHLEPATLRDLVSNLRAAQVTSGATIEAESIPVPPVPARDINSYEDGDARARKGPE